MNQRLLKTAFTPTAKALLARIAYGAIGAVLGAIIGLSISTLSTDAFLTVVLVGVGAIVGFLVGLVFGKRAMSWLWAIFGSM